MGLFGNSSALQLLHGQIQKTADSQLTDKQRLSIEETKNKIDEALASQAAAGTKTGKAAETMEALNASQATPIDIPAPPEIPSYDAQLAETTTGVLPRMDSLQSQIDSSLVKQATEAKVAENATISDQLTGKAKPIRAQDRVGFKARPSEIDKAITKANQKAKANIPLKLASALERAKVSPGDAMLEKLVGPAVGSDADLISNTVMEFINRPVNKRGLSESAAKELSQIIDSLTAQLASVRAQ